MTTADETIYELTLYVSGASDLSARAIAGARRLCESQQQCRLTVCEVHDDPAAVSAAGVLVTPTLVRHHPGPVRMYAGDVWRTDEVVAALELSAPSSGHDVDDTTSPAPTVTRGGT